MLPVLAQAATISHKRTSGAAENNTSTPKNKRRVNEPRSTSLRNVYIVIIASTPEYHPESSEIQGVYSLLRDANNTVRRLANDVYSATEDPHHGMEDDGRVYWESNDVGEGESVRIWVKLYEVMPPGSEPDCEFSYPKQDESKAGSSDDDEDLDS